MRNRLRGGGGGDGGSHKAAARSRSELERSTSRGVDSDTAGSQAGNPKLYGGGLDNVRTLWHALRAYYMRQLADPITLIMLLHLVLTVVHFIVWASSYGGVNGSGPKQVCLCIV